MKILKSYILQMLAVVVFAVLIICFWDMEQLIEEQERYHSANDNWSVEIDGVAYTYEELPDDVAVFGDGNVVLRRKLNDVQGYTDCIAFYTSHQLVDVYIGTEHVYKLYPPEGTTSKTPGNMWNFVTVTPEDVGTEITVVISNCYKNGKIPLPDFYCGARDSIMMWHIGENALSFFISIILLLIGIVLVVAYFGVKKTMRLSQSVLWLGLFAIPLASWSMLECQIITFFTDQILLFSQITFAVLKLTLVPVLQFVSIIYEKQEDKVIKGLCIVSMVEFWITTILQLAGIMDYKETFWITHVIFVVAAVYVLRETIGRFFVKEELTKKSKQVIMTHTICVGIVALAVLADVFSYYTTDLMDSAKFSRLGFLIYVVVLALQLLNDSVQLMRAGKQVNTIRKEAETDVLTKLRNRRAFEGALNSLVDTEMDDYGIIMCDLNNLKKFNDVYGHSIGDYYIIVSGEMIQNIFGEYGRVYRIGGDEFCVIVKGIVAEQVKALKKELTYRLHEISDTQFACQMEAAVGFAQFDRMLDKSLSDTMKRADANMYQSKREMKAQILIEKMEKGGKH